METVYEIDLRRHPLTARVAQALARCCGTPEPGPVVVGASGGADSTALLLAMAALRDRGAGVTPIAVHVHHHLRGPEADADAAFVEDLAGTLAVPHEIRHVEPAALGGNLAAAARLVRYEALRAAAADSRAVFVAVAHHAEDQLETMLAALGRGAGPAGLAGMRARRPLDEATTLVRPLLDSSRADCESLCRAAGVAWRDDAGNASTDTTRGRLRHHVLPVLEDLWPGVAARIARSADLLRAAAEALAQHLDAAFGEPSCTSWRREDLRALSRPVLMAGLRRAALQDDADALGQRLLAPVADAILDEDLHPRRFDWPGGRMFEVTADEVFLHD